MFAQAGFKRQSIEYRFLAALRESNLKEAQFWKWALTLGQSHAHTNHQYSKLLISRKPKI